MVYPKADSRDNQRVGSKAFLMAATRETLTAAWRDVHSAES